MDEKLRVAGIDEERSDQNKRAEIQTNCVVATRGGWKLEGP